MAKKKKKITKKVKKKIKSKYDFKEGDKIFWDDEDPDFYGEYEIAWICDKIIVDDTRIWLYNDELGEVEVSAIEIKNKKIED